MSDSERRPTPEQLMRDLDADLKVIEAATPGPWHDDLDSDDPDGTIEASGGGCVCGVTHHGNVNTVARTGETFCHDDARFIAASREGWGAAAVRAKWAEAEVARLREENAELRARLEGIE